MALAVVQAPAKAEEFPPEQIRLGAAIYERNCSPCHGPRLNGEESAFNLKKFPHDAQERFFNSVTRGKSQMPAWGDLLKPDDIAGLWAYVVAGER